MRSTASSIGLRLAVSIALLAVCANTASAEPLDIEGTWYVLIHYQDPKTANPDVTRWKDLVWVFERKGTRLEWIEYPTVFFEDASGRFERLGNNPRTRVLGPWEPNPAQRSAIDRGPMINQRGKKRKTLNGSDEGGWKSSGRMPQSGGMVMGYHELLTIEGLVELPRFERKDFVGYALAASEGGGTAYRVVRIQRQGNRLIGDYERDGHQKGTFRMWRTPPVRGLSERTRTDEDAGDAQSTAPSGTEGPQPR